MVPAKQQAKAIAGGVVALISLLGAIGVVAPDAFDVDRIENLVLAIVGGVAAVYAAVYQISNGRAIPDRDEHHDGFLCPPASTLLALVLTGSMLIGCAVPQVETTEDRLALSAITLQTLAGEVQAARDRGAMDDEGVERAKAQLLTAYSALVSARMAAGTGNTEQTATSLRTISAALQVVRGILNEYTRRSKSD